MLLVGTGEGGLEQPHWEKNLRLALAIQNAVNKTYPTLARPVAVVPERYNQHLTDGSLLLEVGSIGNTLSEAVCAVRLFARAAGPPAAVSCGKTDVREEALV
jgi:stage II sporulation protein P